MHQSLKMKHNEEVAEGWKDTVSPWEQHSSSYHLSKDAADWPHVHWDHTHKHIEAHAQTHMLSCFWPWWKNIMSKNC